MKSERPTKTNGGQHPTPQNPGGQAILANMAIIGGNHDESDALLGHIRYYSSKPFPHY
jgi:hypothetical protein